MSRADVLRAAAVAVTGAAAGSCGADRGGDGARETGRQRVTANPARLAARAASAPEEAPDTGVRTRGRAPLDSARRRRGQPGALRASAPGAGGSARDALGLLLPLADEHALVLAAPQSREHVGRDRGGYGPDVEAIDALLAEAFATVAVDAGRVAIGGFSDGVSYALSLGLANGDLFRSILAFSPGFSAEPKRRGSPRVFLSHGRADRVLPIETTSRRIVPRLRKEGYDVRYREFAGPHTVPGPVAREAVEWWLE